MSSNWGNNIKISIFGESHSKSIGVVVDGLPAGEEINLETLGHFMARRSSMGGKTDTPRMEADFPEIQSGFLDGHTCGTPICAVIQNTNTRSADYNQLKETARPGHADYTGYVRYHGYNDIRGGGHFSGRLTAPLVFAGGICKQILANRGIDIGAHIYSIADVLDDPINPVHISRSELLATSEQTFPVFNKDAAEKMKLRIDEARRDGDSVGGQIECIILGVPAGMGSPMFDGVENRIASIIFGIPAIKGLEFGTGFDLASMKGSQANDAFVVEGGEICTTTNNNGGILGGISNGMPIVFRVAVKPTASISQEQKTVNFVKKENTTIAIHGRHDPCIVRRAVPCVEAAAAIALTDLLFGQYR